jgi:hypothetical protein
MAYCITKSFGIENIKATVPKWLAALAAGSAAAPKCEGVTRAGVRCGRVRMRGMSRCHNHLQGPQRDIADAERAAEAAKNARSTNPYRRERALRTLAAIERRRLHRVWKLDPTIPGTTLALPEHDERRVEGWLKAEHGIVLDDTKHETGDPLSARCVDRLRWAAALRLTGRVSEVSSRNRVAAALRDDLAWFEKMAAMED